MKLQPASRKEIRRIALGTLACDGILLIALFLLSLVGVGTFSLGSTLLGIFCGSAVAILNFTILCLTVQSAVGMENRRKMKARFQFSYNARMLLQAGWVVAAFLIPQISFFAGALPILFPHVLIYYLQSTRKLIPKDSAHPDTSEPS